MNRKNHGEDPHLKEVTTVTQISEHRLRKGWFRFAEIVFRPLR